MSLRTEHLGLDWNILPMFRITSLMLHVIKMISKFKKKEKKKTLLDFSVLTKDTIHDQHLIVSYTTLDCNSLELCRLFSLYQQAVIF